MFKQSRRLQWGLMGSAGQGFPARNSTSATVRSRAALQASCPPPESEDGFPSLGVPLYVSLRSATNSSCPAPRSRKFSRVLPLADAPPALLPELVKQCAQRSFDLQRLAGEALIIPQGALTRLRYYEDFAWQVLEVKRSLCALLDQLRKQGRRIAAYPERPPRVAPC